MIAAVSKSANSFPILAGIQITDCPIVHMVRAGYLLTLARVGFSVGCGSAMLTALKYPKLWGTVASLAAALDPPGTPILTFQLQGVGQLPTGGGMSPSTCSPSRCGARRHHGCLRSAAPPDAGAGPAMIGLGLPCRSVRMIPTV